MGAYLHLRRLSELESLSEYSTKAERFHSPDEPSAVVVASTTSGEEAARTTSSTNCNSVLSNEMNDCSKFWAGQLDDISEELQSRKGSGNGAFGSKPRTGLDDSERRYGGKHFGEREVDGEVNGNDDVGDTRRTQVSCKEIVAISSFKSGDINRSHQATVTSSSSPCGLEIISDGKGSRLTEDRDGGIDEFRRVSSEAPPEDEMERLPDHLLIELLVRVPTQDWPAVACVKKRWAQLFNGDGLWHSALLKKWPGATFTKRWPGPISRGSSKRQFDRCRLVAYDGLPFQSGFSSLHSVRVQTIHFFRRYTALCISDALFAKENVEGVNEVAGHVYLFLKEQLESSTPPLSYGLLHGTIVDQFLACCKTGDEAHHLASQIWIAVLDNLDESENTFHLLMRIAEEWEVFLPYPYSKSRAVQWRLFERLFTDFRDCLSQYNYFDVLTRARNKFELIPQTWLGY